jgi:hypothetical protein
MQKYNKQTAGQYSLTGSKSASVLVFIMLCNTDEFVNIYLYLTGDFPFSLQLKTNCYA